MKNHWIALLAFVFVVSTGYIFAFATPSVFYMANVLLHLLLGTVLAAFVVATAWRRPDLSRFARIGLAILVLCGIAGLYLAIAGATRQHTLALWSHIALGM